MIQEFRGHGPVFPKSAFIASTAVVIGRVYLGANASIWYNAVARGDINEIHLGDCTNVQDGSMLHVTNRHGLVIGDRVTVGHNAIIHGCEIGSDCLIAMGSIVLDGASIEPNCIIGAGTLIPPGMKVPTGSLVLGSPGRVVRELKDEDLARIESGWRNYVDYAAEYLALAGS